MSAPETVHWGMASEGNASLCGAIGVKRTAIRLVSCVYCQNIIDHWLHENQPQKPGPTEKLGKEGT